MLKRSVASALYLGTTCLVLAVFGPSQVRGQTWEISEVHEQVRLFVQPGVAEVHVDRIRLGIAAFNRYAREGLQRPLQRPARFHAFINASTRYPVMRAMLNLSDEQLQAQLGIGVLGTPKGCIDCSRPDGSIWLRLDEEWMQSERPGASVPFITAHALNHMWQFEHDSSRREPQWWQEGVADYVGFRAVDTVGHIAWERSLTHMRQVVIGSPVAIPRDVAAHGLTFEEATRTFYQWNQRARGAGYSLFALMAHRLVERHGPTAITTYYAGVRSGQPWAAAFNSAFKSNPSEAYQELLRWLGI